jgi:hypothetical protein
MAAVTLEQDIADRVSERIRSEQTMAADAKRVFWSVEGPTFDMRSLIRLGIWGGSATVALGLAVISASSSSGSQRLTAAASSGPASSQPMMSDIETAAQVARTAEETRRLADQVRALAADRELLLTRIASLEHGLDDVTGSIKHAAASNPPAAAMPAAPSTPVAASPPAAPSTPAAPTAAAAPAAVGAAPPLQTEAANLQVPPPIPHQAAALIAPPETSEQPVDPPADTPIPASGLGVDVGGAVNFEGLRTLWFSTRHNNPDLSDELYPVVAVRENNKSHNVDLRLVIGPITNPEAAARFCAGLLASHHYCQTVAFEGQRLSVVGLGPKSGSSSSRHLTSGP